MIAKAIYSILLQFMNITFIYKIYLIEPVIRHH